MQKIPTLIGTGGHVNGEEMKLDYGKTLVVGRSRAADFSLRRLESVLAMFDTVAEFGQAPRNGRAVVAVHRRIEMRPGGLLEVLDHHEIAVPDSVGIFLAGRSGVPIVHVENRILCR